jgi:hypothetical protein
LVKTRFQQKKPPAANMQVGHAKDRNHATPFWLVRRIYLPGERAGVIANEGPQIVE